MFYVILMSIFFFLGGLAYYKKRDAFPPIVFFYYGLIATGMASMQVSHSLLINMLRYYLYIISGALALLIPSILIMLALLILFRSRSRTSGGSQVTAWLMGGILLVFMLAIFLGVFVTQNIAFEVVVEILSQITIYLIFSLLTFAVLTFILHGIPKAKLHKVILILGMELEEQGDLAPPLVARLERFVHYYHQRDLADDLKIIVTGGTDQEENEAEAQVMQAYLIAAGLKKSQIIKEKRALNTEQNFIFSRRILDQLGIETDQILVFTSRYHLVRAAYLSWQAGLRADFIGSDTSVFSYFYHLVRDYVAFSILTQEWNFVFIFLIVVHVLISASGGW